MNNIIKRTWNQNRMVNIEDLSGMAFQAESGGHTFEISGVNDAGESVELSGTVSGVFLRPDLADIAIVGSAEDGVVSVTLPADCYAVNGRFGLTIFVTSDDQKVAVYAAVGTVTRTSGGAVAGDTPQDVVDLINAINAALTTIPADYTDLMAAVAPTYSSSALYSKGAYAWYDGVLYKAIVDITTAETFTEAHWVTADIGSDVTLLTNGVLIYETVANITTWVQGGINTAAGGNTVSSTRVRGTIGLITADTQTLEFPGYDAMLFKYSTDAYSTSVYEGSNGSWIEGGKADLSDYLGKYVRVCLRYHDNSEITPSDISGVKVTKTAFTDTSLSLTGKAADAKTVGDRIANVESTIGEVVTANFTKPATGNAVLNFAYQVTANKEIALVWIRSGAGAINDSANVYTRATATGSNIETLCSNLHQNEHVILKPTSDAAYLRIVATASGTVYVCDADTLQGRVGELEQLTEDHDKDIARVPLTRFEFNHDLYDSSAIVTAMGLTTENRAQQMQKTYDFFHTLAQTYSDYVTEILDATTGVDGETPTGLSYPWYAADGVTVGPHTITVGEDGDPTETINYNFTTAVSPYMVRLYKLCDTNPALPSTGKKKVFLVGGTHGNEVVAPIDLCILASRLCGAVDDPDILKLRSAFDFYIIPVLNGFGAQYLARVNGNLVDLNRNFPTDGWTKTTITESTFSNLALCTFSGKSAGSEFETQLIMKLFEQIQPDVLIDHHNSGTGASQFYTLFSNSYVANLCYQALTDCAYTFIKRLPAYFGTNYNLFSGSNVSPGTLTAANGHMDGWAYENGCLPSGTCEVFEAINFVNGVRNVSPDKYTTDTFKVSEYTLRSVLLHLCQYAMEH